MLFRSVLFAVDSPLETVFLAQLFLGFGPATSFVRNQQAQHPTIHRKIIFFSCKKSYDTHPLLPTPRLEKTPHPRQWRSTTSDSPAERKEHKKKEGKRSKGMDGSSRSEEEKRMDGSNLEGINKKWVHGLPGAENLQASQVIC